MSRQPSYRLQKSFGLITAALLLFVPSNYVPSNQAVGQMTGPGYESESAVVPVIAPPTVPPTAKQRKAVLRFDLVAGNADHRIDRLIEQMTLAEKVGQLVQIYPNGEELDDKTANLIRTGAIGSLFYPGNRSVIDEAQRIAEEESRLGIPLMIARDVVHGLRTIYPIPLGQAASWNPDLVEEAARASAVEARSEGIDWTFAPMVDLCRDARWGRIAETLGEDPQLAGDLAAAMVRGFQQDKNGQLQGVLACAKHYVGYGMTEGGRDYNRVSVSQLDMHNLLLPPFRQSHDAGCRTMMTTFSSVNGTPGTAHAPLLNGVLKRDWGFDGFVVSDWGSINEMIEHGYARDNAHAGQLAINAGVDMDMCSPAFPDHLAQLVADGKVSTDRIDDAVRRVLRQKVALAGRSGPPSSGLLQPSSLELAREAARQSVVLLKNDKVLPLEASKLSKIAVIGPMADAPQQQLGCWSLDGKAEDSITPLADLRNRFASRAEILYTPGAKNTFDEDPSQIEEAVRLATQADVALLFVGEDAVLSGEARCRTSLDLPGVQTELINAVAKTGTPTVVVFLAGRPLTIGEELKAAGAVMYAWHPGTMAGPAITDLLLGDACPSGKLPVTFPRSVGQTPIYYNHPNTGRPAPEGYKPLVGSGREDLRQEHQYRSHYLDEELGPLFPFGYGLSYATFEYSPILPSTISVRPGQSFTISTTVTNTSNIAGVEVVQLYLRDKVANVVRPVKELKAYRRVELAAGESREVAFLVGPEHLSYFDTNGQPVLEPGTFLAGIGGDSTVGLTTTVELSRPAVKITPVHHDSPTPTAVTPAPALH